MAARDNSHGVGNRPPVHVLVPPALLILDEPSPSLDQEAIELLKTELARQVDEGCIVLVADHSLSSFGNVNTRWILDEKGAEHLTDALTKLRSSVPANVWPAEVVQDGIPASRRGSVATVLSMPGDSASASRYAAEVIFKAAGCRPEVLDTDDALLSLLDDLSSGDGARIAPAEDPIWDHLLETCGG